MIVVPLAAGGEVIGTLNIGRMGLEESHFSANEFELTKLFAGQASIALQNAEIHRAVEVRAELDSLTGLRNHGAFQRELGDAVATDDGSRAGAPDDGPRRVQGIQRHARPPGRRRAAPGDRDRDRRRRSASAIGRTATAATSSRSSCPGSVTPRPRRSPSGSGRRWRRGGRRGRRDRPGRGISIGVATFPHDGRSKDALVRAADANLYLAKPSHAAAAGRRSAPPTPTSPRSTRPRSRSWTGSTRPSCSGRSSTGPATWSGRRTGSSTSSTRRRATWSWRSGPACTPTSSATAWPAAWACPGPSGTRASRSSPPTTTRMPTRDPTWPTGVLGAVVGIPLISGDEVRGVLGLASGDLDVTFGEREVEVLGAVRRARLARPRQRPPARERPARDRRAEARRGGAADLRGALPAPVRRDVGGARDPSRGRPPRGQRGVLPARRLRARGVRRAADPGLRRARDGRRGRAR